MISANSELAKTGNRALPSLNLTSDFFFLNPLKKGKILNSERGVNSILTTILRFKGGGKLFLEPLSILS